ncbi:MAG: hypothetical protein L0331_15945, partial [Chloroflexi bacterium]|nr:hypothetical protein [Chloroflexota bacterium]
MKALERAGPWLVLLILFIFTYARFIRLPYAGLRYGPEGEIVELYVGPEAGVRLDDQLIRVGAVSWADFQNNPRQVLFDGRRRGEIVPLEIQRDGQTVSIAWRFPGPTFQEFIQRLNSEWWLAYVFWLAGTATALLIRPRDARWRLLVAFNYLTAIWIIIGGVASWHVWESYFLFRAFIWLALPVYLHLHWLFPRPLGRLPAVLPWIGYLAAVALAGIEWLQLLPDSAYGAPFLLAIGGSLILLAGHFVLRPGQRRDLALLAAAVGVVLIPLVGVLVAQLTGIPLPAAIQGGALLALPALPGAYFYTIYRQQLGGRLAVQTRRLLRLYLATILFGTVLIIALGILASQPGFAGSTIFIGVAVGLLAVLIAIMSLAPFLLLAALAEAYNVAPVPEAGAVEIRANQLLVPFLFFTLLGALAAVLAALAEAWFNFTGATLLAG